MITTKLASLALDKPVHYFTRDVSRAVDENWYAGSVSNLGGALWFVGATAVAIAWVASERRGLGSPLLHAALLLGVVGADDLFLIHEGIYSKVVDEKLVFAVYAALFVAFTVVHRKALRDHGVLAFVPLALAFFAASTFMDLRYDEKQAIEDGTKLLGIATLAVMAVQLSLSSLGREGRPTALTNVE